MTRVLPKSWEEKTLGEVCEIVAGQSPESSFYNQEKRGVPFYQGKKEFSSKYINPAITWTNKITKIALANDILMSVRAPVGPVNYATEKCCIGRGLAAIRPKKDLETDFVFYFLQSIEKEIAGHDGTVFNSISRKEIEKISIPVPSLPEQKRIVEKLDKIFADIDKAKENTQKNLANAKELFKNSLDMLLEQDKERYPITSLGRVATLIPGIAFKSKEFGNFPQKAVKISNILPPKISNSLDGVDIGAYNKEKISKYLLRKGDICVAMTGGTIGKLGMYDLERETYVNQRVLLIRSTSEINCKFLHYILMHPKFLLFIKSNIESDTAQPNISADTIGKYKFFLPTIDKQRVLLKRLTESENKTQELEQIYTKKLVNLEELKQSVLQQAFSGKL